MHDSHLVALTRKSMFDTNAREFDAAMTAFAEDAVFDMTSAGLGRFEGAAAIRAYLEDWIGSYEEQRFSSWAGEELGNGVVFVVAHLDARPRGSAASVDEGWAFTVQWAGGAIVSVVANPDIDAARETALRTAARGE